MVYVAEARSIYKIGRSKNPDKRILSVVHTCIGLRLGRGECPVIVQTVPITTYRTEFALHWLFRHKRLRGEWFELTADDLAWIAKQTEKSILQAADAEWYRTCDLPKGKKWRARGYRVWVPTAPRQLTLFKEQP